MTTPAADFEDSPEYHTDSPTQEANDARFSPRRVIIFLGVISTILLSATGLVLLTWNHFMGNVEFPAWQFLPPLLTLLFPASMLLSWRFSNLFVRFTYRTSAIWLGLLNFAFFAALGAWVFAAISGIAHVPVGDREIGTIFFGGAVAASVYGLINASWLRTTCVTVGLNNLPQAWEGKNVALVTDMHLGNVRGAAFSRKVVSRLQDLNPEVIFISGDMFDGVPVDFDSVLAPWKELARAKPVYYVSGNHEEFDDRNAFFKAVSRSGIRILNNEKTEFQGLQIIGIHDGELHDREMYKSILDRARIDREHASILLAHQPKNLTIPEEAGISLQLSGHTHRGQIWPWHLLATRVHGPFVYGLNRFRKMQVFTSSGAGTWGIPMRAATRSEVVLIRLEPEGNKSTA